MKVEQRADRKGQVMVLPMVAGMELMWADLLDWMMVEMLVALRDGQSAV